jgi:hypothetical protein
MWLSLTRRRVPAALSLCLFLYKADAATEAGWLPDRLTIDKIEAALVMPEGAAPLSAYRRRYGGVIEAGRRVIWGVFLLSTIAPDDAAITILDHRPSGGRRLLGRHHEIRCGLGSASLDQVQRSSMTRLLQE